MQIDKSDVVDFLREAGQDDRADQAAAELPDRVDTDKDSGLLATFGVNPQDLLGGTGGLGGEGSGL
jgi:hypothetical protein